MDQYFWILAVVVNDHPPIFPNPKKKADISFVALVGNDARKVVADGYPLENVVTSDLHQGPFLRFRDYHHMLGTFRGTLITHVCRIRGSRAQALQDDAGDLLTRYRLSRATPWTRNTSRSCHPSRLSTRPRAQRRICAV